MTLPSRFVEKLQTETKAEYGDHTVLLLHPRQDDETTITYDCEVHDPRLQRVVFSCMFIVKKQ